MKIKIKSWNSFFDIAISLLSTERPDGVLCSTKLHALNSMIPETLMRVKSLRIHFLQVIYFHSQSPVQRPANQVFWGVNDYFINITTASISNLYIGDGKTAKTPTFRKKMF